VRNLRLQNLVLAAVMAALVAAVAPIRLFLPGLPTVPVTLQVLVVLLAGGLLRPAWAAAAMGLYLLLGAVGLPVFAGANGGLQVLVGPTAGYLWSYPLAAAVVGAAARRGAGLVRTGLAMLAGLGVIYLGGAGWALAVGGKGLAAVMSGWVLPFIPFDLLKVALAAGAATAVNRALAQAGVRQAA
jgi:biotin transport system substrate-specific component